MKWMLVFVALYGCGVEKGGKTTYLPVQPSAESIQKKEYAVDPLGYSTGRFTFPASMSTGARTVDAAGNVYVFFRYAFYHDGAFTYVPVALKFGPDGKVVQGFDPVGNYSEVFGGFLLDPKDLTVSAQGHLMLLADTKESAETSASTTGTGVVSFTSEGYMNSEFGTSGVVLSSETGYRVIRTSNQNVYVGGNSAIRRLAASGGAADKPYGKSADFTGDSFSSFFVSASDVLVSISKRRYDAAGVKAEDFDDVSGSLIGYEPGLNGFLFYSHSDNELVLAGDDGKKVATFGTAGTASLPWMSGLEFPRFDVRTGRILAYDHGGDNPGYSVFNSDGTPIAGFGQGSTGICGLEGKFGELLQLPTGNVLVFDEEDRTGRIRHFGPACQEIAI